MFSTKVRLYSDQYRRFTKVKVWKFFGFVYFWKKI